MSDRQPDLITVPRDQWEQLQRERIEARTSASLRGSDCDTARALARAMWPLLNMAEQQMITQRHHFGEVPAWLAPEAEAPYDSP